MVTATHRALGLVAVGRRPRGMVWARSTTAPLKPRCCSAAGKVGEKSPSC